jgi:hypothetical protein
VRGSTPFLAANRRTELLACLRPQYNTSHIHESLLISKQLGSYCGIKVPDQPSTLVHVHEYLCVDTEDCWGYRLKMREFVSVFSLFQRDEKARPQGKSASKEYTELLAPKLGCIKPRKFLLKLQGSGQRTSQARAYKRLPFRA